MDTNQEQKTQEKDIGAVWVKKASNGAQFLSFTIDLNQFGVNQKVSLVGFKNKSKKEAKHPDFRVFVSNREATGGAAKPATPTEPSVSAQDLDI